MNSVFETFAADAAECQGDVLGETVIVTPLNGEAVTLHNVTVLRGRLSPRAEDNQARLEELVDVQIPMGSYPGGVPNVGGDVIAVKVRPEDGNWTPKKISTRISSVGGMFCFGLD